MEDEVTANAAQDGAGLHDAMYTGRVDPRGGKVVKPSLLRNMATISCRRGIIDTILNRLASNHWGNDVSRVVNSWAQFSDVNSENTIPLARNNVDQLSVNDARFAKASKMVDEYLIQRAASTPSIVDDNLNYANPNHSSKKNLVWIYKLDGPKFGEHRHGTVDELRKYKPGEFGINLPKEYYPDSR